MKKLFLLLALLGFTATTFAQEKSDSLEAKQQIDTRDRLVFELVHNNWHNKPEDVAIKWYNRGVNALVLYDFPLLGKNNNVSAAPGFGISNSNIYSDSYISTDTAGVSFFQNLPATILAIDHNNDTTSIENVVRRNKLSTTYLSVPLELRFRTNPDKFGKSWKLALGARVGYCLDAHTNYKGGDFLFNTSNEIHIKDKALPNIPKWRYGVTARLGYSNFNVFGHYSLSTLFDKDQGPGIHPFSVGISFNSF